MAPRRFVWTWLVGALGMLALVALINVIVDPYDIYGWVSIAGFNSNKTQAIAKSRMTKPYLIERTHPATLLLGSSRVEAGFNPESTAWPETLRPVLNLGLPGAGPYGQFRILQDALATTRPKLVFMGISFAEAQIAPTHNVPGAAKPAVGSVAAEFEGRLRVAESGAANPGFRFARMKDLARTLLSLNALGDSILTMLNQNAADRSRLTSLGFNTAADFRELVRTDGENSLFVAKDREKIAELLQWSAEPHLDTESRGSGNRVGTTTRCGSCRGDRASICRRNGDLSPSWRDPALRQLAQTDIRHRCRSDAQRNSLAMGFLRHLAIHNGSPSAAKQQVNATSLVLGN